MFRFQRRSHRVAIFSSEGVNLSKTEFLTRQRSRAEVYRKWVVEQLQLVFEHGSVSFFMILLFYFPADSFYFIPIVYL